MELLGFASGTYIDGSTIYPGTGNNLICGENPSPASISLANTYDGPGAYMQCDENLHYDNSNNVSFFVKHDNLKWIETNITEYSEIEGALKVGQSYVGRINVTTSNGTYQVIGKIFAGSIYYRFVNSIL